MVVDVRSPCERLQKKHGASRPSLVLGFFAFSFAALSGGCLNDRAAFESALEGVTVERTTTERYPPTTSFSVFAGSAVATEAFVEIAHLRTTVFSEAILGRGPAECDRTMDRSEWSAYVDADKIHLWTQLFLGNAARRLGANAVIVRGWEIEATCPPDQAFAAGEAVGEAVVGGLLDAPGSVGNGRGTYGPQVKLATTIQATAVRYLRSNLPSTEK